MDNYNYIDPSDKVFALVKSFVLHYILHIFMRSVMECSGWPGC